MNLGFFRAQTLKSETWFWGMVSPYFGVVQNPASNDMEKYRLSAYAKKV